MQGSDRPCSRLVGKSEVLARVSLSFPTVWDMIRKGIFPAGRIVGGKTMWLESDVDQWIATRPERKYKRTGGPPVKQEKRV
jgi:predicted DNA-binding transcriptional regulator AlpA